MILYLTQRGGRASWRFLAGKVFFGDFMTRSHPARTHGPLLTASHKLR